jgi:hypothetical protein
VIVPFRAPQAISSLIGAEGCYYLSILELARRVTGIVPDPIALYDTFTQRRNKEGTFFMAPDCFVNDPVGIFEYCTGLERTMFFKTPDLSFAFQPGDLACIRYEWKTTGSTKSHFVCANEEGTINWDPYGISQTVRFGQPMSYRVFRRAPSAPLK